ncbi:MULTISPECIES: cation diffusion facilitator family transporter [unclassified Methylobacterium]|uniref:cation diffusion facilitator family transporter n=1 Tax=unclassified Methylobacterium TaxID=2615210 RepID=UPI0006F9AC94|nr:MULTISPECIES: cation diffusion facilitator family transporter [unclassified Methylobacterium]KQP79208.1 cobalt transporter [Methylobacterium sp. Leaf117]KQU17574.1 cobalt transporter [Methylobacterium sp. Leaf94]
MTTHDAHAGHDHGSHDHEAHSAEGHAGHSHGPGHSHAPASFGKAFATGIALNVGFVAVEATYGVLGNSMALLADAGHNLSDVLGLVVAWVAMVLAKRAPSARYTYGMKGSSILAALFNAVFLLVAVGAIAWEAIQRFGEPVPVAGKTVMVVAAVGILVNGITAWLFASGAKGDINIKGAFLHMAADAAVSAGVVIAGLVILYTGWTWLDPVVSLAIVAVIVWSTWGLLRDSLTLSLAAVPPGIDPAAVRSHLEGLPGVTTLHDLHIWAMSTTETCLTAHLLMPGGRPDDVFLMNAAAGIKERFGIGHTTLQVETSADTACALAPANVV